jgi:hypothetical protein
MAAPLFYPRQTDYIVKLNELGELALLAIDKGEGALQAKIDAEAARDLANQWATKLTTAVAGGEFSAKYHAQAAAGSASTASNHVTTAQNWATSLTVVGSGLYGARYYANDASTSATSAKNWATQLTTEVVTGQGYSARQYASNASGSASAAATSATSAQNWATQLTTEVVTGQGYSARQYASNASGSASSASTSATAAQNWATSMTTFTGSGGLYGAKYYADAAANSASAANTSKNLASDWAIKTSATVDGTNYSAKYHADRAQTYADTVVAGQIQADWTQTNTASKDFIKNKPTIPTNTNQLTNGSNFITSAGAPVQSVAGKTGAVVLAKADVGLSNVEDKSSSTIRGEFSAAFGVGAVTPPEIGNIDSFTTVSGTYLMTASTTGTKPATYGVVVVSSYAGGGSSNNWAHQMVTSTDGKVWYRNSVNLAAWSAWAEIAFKGNTEPALPSGGTTTHYLRGDKTWQDFSSGVRGVALPALTNSTTAIVANDNVYTAFGKLQGQVSAREVAANKDAASGYAGLNSDFSIVLKNATATSKILSAATAARTWTMPDKNGTMATTGDIGFPTLKHLDLGTIATATTVNIDLSVNPSIRVKQGANVTIGSITNWPAAGNRGFCMIELEDGGKFTFAITPTIQWMLPDGKFTTNFSTYMTTIARSLQNPGIDFIALTSTNQGTTIYGRVL